MRKMQPKEWIAKTERLNADLEIIEGDHVEDVFSYRGVVVSVEQWEGSEDGTVFVEIEPDYVETYSLAGWRSYLRIIQRI